MPDLDLPGERAGYPPPPALAERRRGMATAIAAGSWATGRPAREDRIGGVRVLRFEPVGEACATVLHLHGGGFRIGAPEMIGPYALALADRCAVEVVLPAYRLAPEHPFPAGLLDAVAVATALGEAGERPLILSGDSAGGGLAAALMRICIARGIAIRALTLHSPWLDLTLASGTYASNAATDALFSLSSAEEAAELYLQGLPAAHPLASPLLGAVTGFPPTFISIGDGEVLAGDGYRFHAALRAAGGRADLLAIADMEHVAVTRDLTATGAPETFAAVAAFIDGLR